MNDTLTEQDHQLLSQFVDGELPEPAARELEQRLASEPALGARLEELNALDSRLKSAFAGPGMETAPRHISRMLDPTPAVVLPLRQRQGNRWGYALAASLAVAVCGALVTQWDRNAGQAGAGMEHTVAQALEQLPSSGSAWTDLGDGRRIRPVLSFRSHSGDWCREYLVAEAEATRHGVACRVEQNWTGTVLTQSKLAIGPGEYRPAGTQDAESVAAFIDQQSADIPLDAEQEAALIARGWQ